ncbi:hypothetical protein H0X32_03440 [Patescibacteria group bacterium]|nr:hypothetical protein [Patescibacteria group bacterium]
MDKNTAIDFVERLRTKPEHVRRRIAFGTTLGVTGLAALGWFFALVFSGSLSLTPNPSSTQGGTLAADGTVVGGQAQTAVTQTKSGFSQLLGAAGLGGASAAPTALRIVDAPTSTPISTENQSPTGGDQTIIPF